MSREPCDQCGARRGRAEYENGSFCHACKHKESARSLVSQAAIKEALIVPEYNEDPMPQEAQKYLDKYYITKRHIRSKHIFWSPLYQRICFPTCSLRLETFLEAESVWARSLDVNRKDKWLFIGPAEQKNRLFRSRNNENNRLIIVEDVVSAIRVADFCDCLALGGTNVNSPQLVPIFLYYDRLVCMFDPDEAGKKATAEFKKRYSLLKPIDVIKVNKDPKCYDPISLERLLK